MSILENYEVIINYHLLADINYLFDYIDHKFVDVKFILNISYLSSQSANLPRDTFFPRPEDHNWVPYMHLISEEFLLETLRNVKSYSSDKDYYKHNEKIYEFLVYFLYTPKIKFKKIELLPEYTDTPTQFKILHSGDNTSLPFNKGASTFLYHGSPSKNIRSILCNGIKICSRTYLETTGAVLGPGIYLSNDLQMALSYSDRVNPIICVFEVITAHNYFKGGSIYVVDDDTKLSLKFFICFENVNPAYLNLLMTKFTNYAPPSVNDISHRRLFKEFSRLNKSLPPDILAIYLPDENINLWHVHLKMDDEMTLDEPLVKDMAMYGIKFIKLEFIFERYPITPPFIRIISPRFENITGHITTGGSICMELLTTQGWDVNVSIEPILISIKSLIFEGKGRLSANYYIDYSLSEARSAFQRMLISHNWV